MRAIGPLVFLGIFGLAFSGIAHAKEFVIDASSSVQYDVARSREDLRTFDQPEFIVRHLPGIKGITAIDEKLYQWDVRISVPLSKPMKGRFLARKEVLDDNQVTYESTDKKTADYMRCDIRVIPQTWETTSIQIAMRLRFTRSSGWQFHWLAPLLGEKFLSARVKDKLDKMLQTFVRNSKREFEAGRKP